MKLTIILYRASPFYYKRHAYYVQILAFSKNAYSHTINLPNSSFPIHFKNEAKSKNDNYIYDKFKFDSLYKDHLASGLSKVFTLHDGPPYANGSPHLGHAVNKIYKDIIIRQHLLKGHKINFVLGWDCHGLPIEIKALKQRDSKDYLTIRKLCRKYANVAIKNQSSAFKRWGVMADWNNCYFTNNNDYETQEIIKFYELYKKGIIYRDFLPIFWSPSSRSTLAESELIYNNHLSQSIYIALRIYDLPSITKNLKTKFKDIPIYAIIWTSCPWTLPFNQAIAYNKDLIYQFVKTNQSEASIIYLAQKDTMAYILRKMGHHSFEILDTVKGDMIQGSTYHYPFKIKNNCSTILKMYHGDFVKDGKGSGLVHIAPAHGHEDFKLANLHHLNKECFVDEDGRYILINGIKSQSPTVKYQMSLIASQLKGLNIFSEKAINVIKQNLLCQPSTLEPSDTTALYLLQESHIHSYPYDWRTNQPVLIKTSSQWFFDTTKVLDKCLSIIPAFQDIHSGEQSKGMIKFGMQANAKRMRDSLLSRSYWCISRQRVWGIPIPVFYIKSRDSGKICDQKIILDDDTINHLAQLFKLHGCDIWWEWDVDKLLPPTTLSKLSILNDDNTTLCGKNLDMADFIIEKGTDIFDIWFDSGLSWSVVLGETQADVCLEGIDQHTGWFQTSLLTSIALKDRPPFKCLLAHGFVVDENGAKMSKSLGNVISPDLITHGVEDLDKTSIIDKQQRNDKKPITYGVDTLRWFVASHANLPTIPFSTQTLDACHRRVSKIRNVIKFLLGASAQAYASYPLNHRIQLTDLDAYFVTLANELDASLAATTPWAMDIIIRELTRFIDDITSGLFITCVKDRLYCGSYDTITSPSSASIAAAVHLECLSRALAPVMPHLVEEISLYHPLNRGLNSEVMSTYTVFRKPSWLRHTTDLLEKCGSILIDPPLRHAFDIIVQVMRTQLNKCETGKNLRSLDLTIIAQTGLYNLLKLLQKEEKSIFSNLVELFGVSSVTISKYDFSNDISKNFYEIDLNLTTLDLKNHHENTKFKYTLELRPSENGQCVRCWKWICNINQNICTRCDKVLEARLNVRTTVKQA